MIRRAAAVLVVLAVGCGGSDEKQSPNAAAGGTPDQLCQTKCAMMSAPACPNAPANWANDCVAMCNAKYTNFPSCDAQLRAMDVCGITKVSYGCSTSGTIEVTPTGACAYEGVACMNCTQSLLDCF